MESKLDTLLDLVREPEPGAELFVGRVMADVRADEIRRARRRRVFTQPAAVAAAAAIVVGAAAFALVRSTDPATDAALSTTQDSETIAPPVANAPPVTAAAPRSGGSVDGPRVGGMKVYRDGDREWGYKSKTAAFAMDHETGLRLETEIYRTEFDTDVPQRITLTLHNTGTEPVAVTAPDGCALVVAAYPEEERDRSEDAEPWQCASTGETPGTSQEAERFVLGAGEKRIAEATVVLGTQGNWSVVGMCQCSYGPADRAEPTDPGPVENPLEDIGEVGAELPAIPTAPRSSEQSKGLVTPPIHVRAS